MGLRFLWGFEEEGGCLDEGEGGCVNDAVGQVVKDGRVEEAVD